jgi:hypothetical protein
MVGAVRKTTAIRSMASRVHATSIKARIAARKGVVQTTPRSLSMGKWSGHTGSSSSASKAFSTPRSKSITAAAYVCVFDLSIFAKPHRSRTRFIVILRMASSVGKGSGKMGGSTRNYSRVDDFMSQIVKEYKLDGWLSVQMMKRLEDDSIYWRLEGIMAHQQASKWFVVSETCRNHMEAKKMASQILAQKANLIV